MRRELQLQLIQLLVRDLLIFDVSADRLLIPPDGRNEVPPRPEFVIQKIAQLAFHILRNPDRAFPLQIPDHLPTEDFGGIGCRLICPNSAFLRYFGVNTTWYLHSHVAWFR